MKKGLSTKLAFVLAGGGARGALQVGALRALLEVGIRPDLLAVPIWDFSQTKILLETGYQQMKSTLEAGKITTSFPSANWLERLMNWLPIRKHETRTGSGKDLKAGKGIRT